LHNKRVFAADKTSVQSVTSQIIYALLVFKIHNDLAPNYLKTVVLFTSNRRYELRSESQCNLAQPKEEVIFFQPNHTVT